MENGILCHPDYSVVQTQRDLVCTHCGSFADLKFCGAHTSYGAGYLTEWQLAVEQVGLSKRDSLIRWLKACDIDVQGLTVCEVGFGGGQCLTLLAELGANCYGIETFLPAIESLPLIPRDRFLLADKLPERLEGRIDLWIFQDSFEHLENPDAFVGWMKVNSAPKARVMLVLPRADSLSAKLMGSGWIHRMPHHRFHWSKFGMIEWLKQRGFTYLKSFSATKTVSPRTIITHLDRRYRIRFPERLASRLETLSFRFNIGEMGLLFVL